MLLAAGLAAALLALVWPTPLAGGFTLGVTYSPRYAASLGFDPRVQFTRMLTELPFREIRLPAYWDDIEQTPGGYDLSELDWYVAEAERHGVSVVPVLGYKAPRWPECHPPAWAASLSVAEKRAAILRLLQVEVQGLRRHAKVSRWQVENEPFFPFGDCDGYTVLDESFVGKEIALVRSLDARPVLVTDSGELSTWIPAMRAGDQFGASLYRSIWFERYGLVSYPIPPRVYAAKERTVRLLTGTRGESIVSELQAEPWFMTGGGLTEVPIAQQRAMFPPSMLPEHVSFARRTGVSTIHLWGVEWWYWMESRGHAEYVQAARSLLDAAHAAGAAR